MFYILILPALIAFLIFLKFIQRPANFPPGPLSLPVIGGLYRLGRDPFTSSIKLARQYGPIVGIDFASYRSIIINDYHCLKSAFTNPALQGRPDHPMWKTKYRLKNGMISGIIAAEGPSLQENHRFTFKLLRQFGFGTKRMEMAILEQVDQIIAQFGEKVKAGESIYSLNLFNHYSSNIIWALMSARKIPEESLREEFTHVSNL